MVESPNTRRVLLSLFIYPLNLHVYVYTGRIVSAFLFLLLPYHKRIRLTKFVALEMRAYSTVRVFFFACLCVFAENVFRVPQHKARSSFVFVFSSFLHLHVYVYASHCVCVSVFGCFRAT